MESHGETPPDGLWEAVEGRLSRREIALSRRRRALRWGGGSAAAAAVAVLAFVIVRDGIVNDSLEPSVGSSTASTMVLESTEPELVSQPEPELAPEHTPEPIMGTIRKSASAPKALVVTLDTDEFPTDPGTPEAPPIDNSRQEQSTPERPAVENRHVPENAGSYGNYGPGTHIPKSRPNSKNKKWQAGLYASNMSPGSSAKLADKGFLELTSDVVSSGGDYSGSASDANRIPSYTNIMAKAPVYTDVKHKLPVTVGVSVGYGLSERWSLVSGVTYSRLSSQVRTTGIITGSLQEQVLHYVGIPMDVKYNVWTGAGGLSVYLSAGGHAAWNVAGRLIDENDRSRSTDISDRMQWSVRGSAGVGYDFTKIVGIYAEPGVDYHFDNGSGIETIYKDKPFNFGLRLGLRFSL